jgi:hypothetical protein
MHTNNRTGPPSYYLERQRCGYIDRYHNYITLMKREEADAKIPINYIHLYYLGYEDDVWSFDRILNKNMIISKMS